MRDREPLEPELDRRLRLLDAVQAAEQLEELLDPQPLGQREVARGEADLFHRLAPLLGQAPPDDLDLALVGRDHAEQHQERRRLARAVRAQERDALTRVDLEVDAVDGADALVLLDETRRTQDGRAPKRI